MLTKNSITVFNEQIKLSSSFRYIDIEKIKLLVNDCKAESKMVYLPDSREYICHGEIGYVTYWVKFTIHASNNIASLSNESIREIREQLTYNNNNEQIPDDIEINVITGLYFHRISVG